MDSTTKDLENKWYKIVIANAKASHKAWREVDTNSQLTGSDKENQYYRNLIATAELYISEEQQIYSVHWRIVGIIKSTKQR